MPQDPLLNITVPVFNRPELTRRTLLAARAHTAAPHVLTAVDNGSEPETRDLLRGMKDRGEIDHLFRLERNYGVAVAANVGWRLVDAPLYMKLDNDIVMHSPRWFGLLLGYMKKLGRDAVWGGDFHGQLDNTSYVTERDGLVGRTPAHVSGGAIIIPRGVSALAGHWSEDYGLYGCEDGDYGARLRCLGVEQFYFDHKPFMEHLGHDAEDMKTRHSLDKDMEQKVFRSLWMTNAFLYEHGLRAPNIPPQYMPADYDGYTLRLIRNDDYTATLRALVDFHKVRLLSGDDPRETIDAVNAFVTVQNRTWEAATRTAQEHYERVKGSMQAVQGDD